MSLDGQRPLACPSCGGPSDLASWLDRAAGATPGSRRVEARCPRCEATAWIELAPGEAAVGALVPGRPPFFRPAQRARQDGLAVEASLDGLLVRWLHRRWVIPSAPRRGAHVPRSDEA